MSTIAQDYAHELRRISCSLFQAGKIDDADELRLAAEYLEQSAKGVALDDDAIEARLGEAQLASIAQFADLVVARQTALFETFLERPALGQERLRDFFDWVTAFYLQQAVVFAVTGERPGGRMLSEQDFIATAREAWMQGVLLDAVAQTQLAGGRS